MDEGAAVSLALDAAQTLKGVSSDVAQIKEVSLEQLRILQDWALSHPAEVEQPAEEEAQALVLDEEPEGAEWVTTLQTTVDVPPEFFSNVTQFAWMQTVLLVFVLAVLLLNLGVNLWKCFSDKWRS
ncbi:hypothetical protein [uncultured Adlercreutzia sp.]|uniref:hypothetical protein n=1 Tax=uncultured Adlercreutzia sp. TaxID=875803 RepID=UPI0026F3A66A|nr:hypothetical protein [uncultured Adlercreutzia sp.]